MFITLYIASVEEQQQVKSLEEEEEENLDEHQHEVKQQADSRVEQQEGVEHQLPKQQQPCIHRIHISSERISKLPKDILATRCRDKPIKIRRSRSGAHKHTIHYSTRHHPYYHTIVEHLYTPVRTHILHTHS